MQVLLSTAVFAVGEGDIEGASLVFVWSDAASAGGGAAVFDLGETKHLAIDITSPSKDRTSDSLELVLHFENPESLLYRDTLRSGYALDSFTAAGGFLTTLRTETDEQGGVTTLVYSIDPNAAQVRIELLLTAVANQVYDGEKLKITASLSAITADTKAVLGSLDCAARVKMEPVGLTGSLRLLEPSYLAEGAQTATVGWSYAALTTNNNWSENSQLGEYQRRGLLFDTVHTSLDFSNVLITARGITHSYAEWQRDFAEYGFLAPPVTFRAADGSELMLNRLTYDTASSAAAVAELDAGACVFRVQTSSEFVSAGGVAPAIDLVDGLDTGVGVSISCKVNGRGPLQRYQQFHRVYYREQGHPLDVPLVYVNAGGALPRQTDAPSIKWYDAAGEKDIPARLGIEQGIGTIPAWDTVLVCDEATPGITMDTVKVDYYASDNRATTPTSTQTFDTFNTVEAQQGSLGPSATSMLPKRGTIVSIDFAGKQAMDYISSEKPGIFVVTYRSAQDDDQQATELTLTLVVAPAVALTYDGNGATFGMPPVDAQSPYAVGTTVEVLPHAGLALPGFIFEGWSTDSQATSAQYVTGSSFTITGDVTLFAIWQQESTPVSRITDVLTYHLLDITTPEDNPEWADKPDSVEDGHLSGSAVANAL